MQPLSVDTALLRAVLTPELNLSVGRELMVRVASLQAAGHGTLSLAGMLLEAELPLEVKAGDELRLQVREMSPTRVVLAIQEEAAPLPPPVAEPPRVPLPSGGAIQVTARDARTSTGPDGSHTVSLRYDAPTLGAVDMTFTLTPAGLRLVLTVPRGSPHALADGATGELSDALSATSGRPVQITINPRHEPLEVYA